jgi:hypothetical protein
MEDTKEYNGRFFGNKQCRQRWRMQVFRKGPKDCEAMECHDSPCHTHREPNPYPATYKQCKLKQVV